MQLITGSCHCHNISIELEWPTDDGRLEVRACSCTFCRRHVGEYISHRDARLRATIADETALSKYRFGTGTAEFQVCARCGVVPFVTSEINGQVYAVVNVNSFDDLGRFRLATTITDFDGETTESRLVRRRSTWIPEVVIDLAEVEG